MDSLLNDYHVESNNFYKALLAQATDIAQKRGYKASGMNAFYVLFAEKFAWTPAQVRSLTLDELSLMLDAFFAA